MMKFPAWFPDSMVARNLLARSLVARSLVARSLVARSLVARSLVALLLLPAGLAYGQKFAITAPPVTAPVARGPADFESGKAHDAGFPVNGWAAPVLGYVVDADGWVHKMPGLAGASWLTGRLDFGVRLTAGVVSPRQNYILGLAVPDGRAVLLPVAAGQGDGQPGTARPLGGVDPGAERVVLSPGGTAAAFYFMQAARLEIVTGLPDAPALSGSLDLSSLPGPAAALAISDDGSLVLASASSSAGAVVFAFSAQAPPRLLLNGGDFPAIVFLPHSPDAILADRLRNALYRIRDAAGSGEVILLASEGGGVSAPVSVAASADGSRFFVANSGSATSSATIGYLSAAGGPLTLLGCSFSPTTLAPLSGNAVFRLTELSGEPLRVFDGDAIEPRLLLVPQAPAIGAGK
jgi:hypothetical protein